MKSRTKLLVGAALIAVLVLGTVSAAMASPVLSLWATRTVVTYPQPSFLKLTASDGGAAVGTAVTVQYRPIGTDTWKNLRKVSASRTAEGTVTVPVGPYWLKGTTAFRAVGEGLESDVVTVSVKAKLSKAIAPSKVRAGRYVKVRGFIWPRHAVGSRPVEVKMWKWEGDQWVFKGSLHPKIVGKTGDRSMWRFTRKADAADKGRWRLQVTHEDLKHIASESRYSYVKVR